MILAHRIALDPTQEQASYFFKAAGVARFAWNWGLARWQEIRSTGGTPNANILRKEFTALKATLYPWIGDVHKDAHVRPFANLNDAFRRYRRGVSGQPRFKSKKRAKQAFYVGNDILALSARHARIPRLGWVRLRQTLRFDGKVMGAVVSLVGDRWYITVQVDVGETTRERKGDGVVGVDLGVKVAAMLSTGEAIIGPKPLARHLCRLRLLSRRHSRKQRGSNNKEKARRRLARLHATIAAIRSDFLNKLTTRLCRENQTVVVEELNVSAMVRNRKLARAISDIGFGEFRRQLEYKGPMFGTHVVVADRWFPSSKLCSRCGTKKEDLTLADRVYACATCGLTIDRDLNAALNLRTAGLAGTHACGATGTTHGDTLAGDR